MMRTRKKKQPLEGERLAWFELAHHLRMPVETLQNEITYSEFLEWQEFLALERNRARKVDFYLAQIAAEIRRSYVKNADNVRLSNFLLRFATPEEMAEEKSLEGRVQKSKSAWLALVGIPEPEKN